MVGCERLQTGEISPSIVCDLAAVGMFQKCLLLIVVCFALPYMQYDAFNRNLSATVLRSLDVANEVDMVCPT